MLRGVFVVLGAAFTFLLAPSAWAEPRAILRTPSTAVLPAWGVSFVAAGRVYVPSPADMTAAKAASMPEMALSVGLFGRAEVGAWWNSNDTGFKAFAGQFKALLLKESAMSPALAAGVIGMTGEKYPFPESFEPTDNSADILGHAENFSWFVVFGKEEPFIGNLYLGIGGGRFQGHGSINKLLYGIFGGWRRNVIGPVWLAGEVDGRSLNAGIGVSLAAPAGLSVNTSLRGEFIQNARSESQDVGMRPALGVALEVVYSPGHRTPSRARAAAAARPRAAATARPRAAAATRRRTPAPGPAALTASPTVSATVSAETLPDRRPPLPNREAPTRPVGGPGEAPWTRGGAQ